MARSPLQGLGSLQWQTAAHSTTPPYFVELPASTHLLSRFKVSLPDLTGSSFKVQEISKGHIWAISMVLPIKLVKCSFNLAGYHLRFISICKDSSYKVQVVDTTTSNMSLFEMVVSTFHFPSLQIPLLRL